MKIALAYEPNISRPQNYTVYFMSLDQYGEIQEVGFCDKKQVLREILFYFNRGQASPWYALPQGENQAVNIKLTHFIAKHPEHSTHLGNLPLKSDFEEKNHLNFLQMALCKMAA